MASFDSIVALVRPQAALCPEVSLRWAILQAARRFCQETRYLRRPIVLDQALGYGRYKLVPNWLALNTDQEVERDALDVIGIKAVEVDGVPLTPDSPERFPQTYGAGRVVIYEPDEIEIFPWTDAAVSQAIAAQCILRPKIDATVLPTSIVTLYADQIAYGALSLLKQMPSSAWSDPPGAARSAAEFTKAIGMARYRADRQGSPRGFNTIAGW